MPDQSSAATEHAIIQEITGPLETLPDDPVALVHAEFPTAMRGYERAAVDEYMQQMSQLVAELQATRSPEAAVRRALERVGEQISGILQRAHETAEQITAQSRREAEDRLEQARGEAAQIAGAAEQRVKDLDGDTDRIWLERQRIVADAEDLAAQLQGLAKSAADRFPADEDAEDPSGVSGAEDNSGAEDLLGGQDVSRAGDVSGAENASVGADETIPYDDEEPPTVAVAPTFLEDDDPPEPLADSAVPEYGSSQTPTATPEFAGDEEDEDFFDDEDELAGDPVEPEPSAAEDIEKTVAFSPLPPSDDEPPEPPGPDRSPNESTAIIPPASQAASRRRQRP